DGTASMVEAATSVAATDLAADAPSAAVTVIKSGLSSQLVDVKPASLSEAVRGGLEAGSQGQENAIGVSRGSSVAMAAAHLGARAVRGAVQRCAAPSPAQEPPSCESMGSHTRDVPCPWPAFGPLQHRFFMEPSKLERMLHDTCSKGRAWRGIVRVPAIRSSPVGPGGPTDNTSTGMEASLKAGNIQRLLSSVPDGSSSIGGGHGDSRMSSCTRILETMLTRPFIPPLQPLNVSKESPVNAEGDTNGARRRCTDTAADGRNTKSPGVAGRWGAGGRVLHASDIAAGPPPREEVDTVDYTRASGGDCTATAVTGAAAAAAITATSTFITSTVAMGTMPSNRNAISHKNPFVELDADPLATSVWGVLGETTSDQVALGTGACSRHLMATAGGLLSPEKVSDIEQLLKTTPLLIATAVTHKDGNGGYDRADGDGGNNSVDYHHFQHVKTDDNGAESVHHPPLATAELFPRETARTETHLFSSPPASAGYAISVPTEDNAVQTLETQRNVLSSPPQNLHILDNMKGALHHGEGCAPPGLLDIRTLGPPPLPQPPLQQPRSSVPLFLQQPQQSPAQSQSQLSQSPQSLASPHGLSPTLPVTAPWACSRTATGTPASYRLRQSLRGRSLLRHTTSRSTCVGNMVSGSGRPGELLQMLSEARASELTATVSAMSATAGRPTATSPQTALSP
ncbi:hypothetical protein VaNZ11_001691, partial [Volvox africanus]